MRKDTIINELNNLINEGEEVLKTKWDYSNSDFLDFNIYVELHKYTSWRLKILTLLKRIMPDEIHYINSIESLKDNYYENAKQINEIIKGILEYVNKDYIDVKEKMTISK